jgi:hypothetical protein
MCSACSNDDPRPEVMGGFAISSSGNAPVFAAREGKRRKHYRTFSFLQDLTKGAFLQGFVRGGAAGGASGADGFAHFGKRAIVGARHAAAGKINDTDRIMRREISSGWSASASGEPSEIRVTGDAIIEVHGTGLLRHVTWEGRAEGTTLSRIEERGELATLSDDDEYGRWVRRNAMHARRRSMCRAIAVYALFATAAAGAIYFVLR